jgi:ketosteroid isomerase-like protein
MLMTTLRTAVLGCVCLALTACATDHSVVLEPAAMDAARAELLAADAAWAEAAATDDVDRIVAFWTDDAIIQRRAGSPPIVGIDAIREFITWNREDRPGFSITWHATNAWVSADGCTGCTMGIGTINLIDESGQPIEVREPYCCVWRKEDGEWKCVLDLGMPEFAAEE